jgi:hypothetical protein
MMKEKSGEKPSLLIGKIMRGTLYSEPAKFVVNLGKEISAGISKESRFC